MKIDFDKALIDLVTDKPFSSKETLKSVSMTALLSLDPKENTDGTKRFELWELAKKVKENSDLTVEEITTIKKRIGMFYTPAVIGPAYTLLENKEVK